MKAPRTGVMLLGLDLFGTMLFAIGALGHFGGQSYWPEPWRFPGHNVVLITIGILLIVPYMVHVVRSGTRT